MTNMLKSLRCTPGSQRIEACNRQTLRTAALAAVLLTPSGAVADTASLEVSIRPGSEAGGLNLRSPSCPGDMIDFRTCEGVVVGSNDFGLFQVKLPATFGDGRGGVAH